MRNFNAAISSIETRRRKKLWLVSLSDPNQADRLAAAKGARHRLLELDLDKATGRSSKIADGKRETTPWRPLSDGLVSALFEKGPADSETALNVRNWQFFVRALKEHGLTLRGVDVVAVRVPFRARAGARQDPMSIVVKSLGALGFRIAEMAAPPGEAASDSVYVVFERDDATDSAGERSWTGKSASPVSRPAPADLAAKAPANVEAEPFPAADWLAQATRDVKPARPQKPVPKPAADAAPKPAPAAVETAVPEQPAPAPAPVEVRPEPAAAPPAPVIEAPAASLTVSSATVAFKNGFAEGVLALAADARGPVHVCVRAADGSPVAIGVAKPFPEGSRREFAFRVWSGAAEPLSRNGGAVDVAAFVLPPAAIIKPETALAPQRAEPAPERAAFGVLVIGHTRQETLRATLKSLSMQGAQAFTHVWLDGDQGRPDQRALVSGNVEAAREAGFANVVRMGGHLGQQKLMIHALAAMCRRYDAFLVLEDNCFPSRGAIKSFREELGSLAGEGSVFSVYGHHFGLEGSARRWRRFQNWGWATWSNRLEPLLPLLAHLSSIGEADYLAWTSDRLTPEIRRSIEITPGRQPTTALSSYFDWSETLGLIAALNGLVHAPTPERVVFACSGHDAGASEISWFRRPPYNMIGIEEVWKKY